MTSLEELEKSSETERAELRALLSEREASLADASKIEEQLRSEIENLSDLAATERSQAESSNRQLKEISESTHEIESKLALKMTELQEADARNRQLQEQI